MVFFQSKRKIIIKYLVLAILAIFISSLLIETKTMTEPRALKKILLMRFMEIKD